MEQQPDTDQGLPLHWHGPRSRYYRSPPGHSLKSNKNDVIGYRSMVQLSSLKRIMYSKEFHANSVVLTFSSLACEPLCHYTEHVHCLFADREV